MSIGSRTMQCMHPSAMISTAGKQLLSQRPAALGLLAIRLLSRDRAEVRLACNSASELDLRWDEWPLCLLVVPRLR